MITLASPFEVILSKAKNLSISVWSITVVQL